MIFNIYYGTSPSRHIIEYMESPFTIQKAKEYFNYFNVQDLCRISYDNNECFMTTNTSSTKQENNILLVRLNKIHRTK